MRVLSGLADVLLTTLAFEAAYQTRLHLGLERVFFLEAPTKALLLVFAVLVYLALGFWFEVHDRLDSGNPRVVLRDTFRQCALGAASVVLFQYVLRRDISRPFLALFAAYSGILLVLFRLSSGRLVRLVRREFGALRYVIVVGLGDRAKRLGEALEASAKYGVRLIGFLADTPEPAAAEVRLQSVYRVHPLADLAELLRRRVVDEILFAVDSERLAELEEVFLLCDEEGVRTVRRRGFLPSRQQQRVSGATRERAAAHLLGGAP